jgi:penicillin-insensitive murein endopeptidase
MLPLLQRFMRFPFASLAALATSLGLSAGAMTGGKAPPRHPSTARATPLGSAALRYGRSMGSPTEGRLIGGTRLDESSYLRVVPADAAGDVRWGIEPLVGMLERSARALRRQFPDAITSVGHLSREGGGEIDQHRSHESGRDADVGFFTRTAGGKPLLASHFVPFRGDGTAPTWPGAYFDDARNWALVASLIGDPEAHVTHLFVASPLRARLLSYAEKVGAPPALRVRAAELMQQPRGTLPHDDHFHVRIGCPARMAGCVENPLARPRGAEPTLAHGRRGGLERGALGRGGLAASPPAEPAARAPSHARGLQPAGPAALPSTPLSPAAATPGEEPAGEPDTPPALMSTPIDDVDG